MLKYFRNFDIEIENIFDNYLITVSVSRMNSEFKKKSSLHFIETSTLAETETLCYSQRNVEREVFGGTGRGQAMV